MGAWIETAKISVLGSSKKSPLTWGRGLKRTKGELKKVQKVAPHVGAWIETPIAANED